MTTTMTAAPAGTVTLEYGTERVSLPLVQGSEGEIGIDILQLRARTGMVTFDPGFGNSGACRSAITFIDGEKGILRYRGYDIADLAAKSSFLEVAWLLLNGELPAYEDLALGDDYFISHKLYPNMDFYSGIIYRALGIPVNMFTVMFTLGRLPSWIAQWLELRRDRDTRIVRPRQIYTGATQRNYVPMEDRP